MEAKPVDEDLRRLQSLLDDGVITESEFTEKKRQLLDQPALPATTTRSAPPGETPPPPKKIKAAPPAAPPTAPPANEPSLPLGYYELRDAGDDVIGYLVLSVWKSSGGFFGEMTLTSGEWEVDDEDPEEESMRTLLPMIDSRSGAQRWSFDGGQFRFDLEEDASYSGTVSLPRFALLSRSLLRASRCWRVSHCCLALFGAFSLRRVRAYEWEQQRR